jgi:hypothetical protein
MKKDAELVREWHIWSYKNNGHIMNAVPEEKITPEFTDIIKRINERIQQLLQKGNSNRFTIFINDLNSLSKFAENIKSI